MQPATVVVQPAALRVRAFQQLTKPGITAFVGLSAAAGYVVTTRNNADPVSLALVVIATMAMSGGAAAMNHISERHLDARMKRTRQRPLPAGVIGVRAATNFAWALTGFGAALAIATLPALTFFFLAACHVTYVYVYTPLKLKSEWCTIVGAIPGA
ncbi:MAG: UbiA family prenyltransferase, partial [Gemmatimonadota bacterium]